MSSRLRANDPEDAAFHLYRASGAVKSLGCDYGKRADRFLACAAYLDGERPSLVMCRGYYDCAAINGSNANPCLCADNLGDWREEVIWSSRDGRELRVFATTAPTERRLTTLMHDPVHRLSVAWQGVAYDQPAHPGFFLGHGTAAKPAPPRPAVRVAPSRPRGQ